MIWVIKWWEIKWWSCISSSTAFCFRSVLKMLCCNVYQLWIAFYPGALLQQGGKDWPVSRIAGEKGFPASSLYLFICPSSLQCFKREMAMLVLGEGEHGDSQLGWVAGSGYTMGLLDAEGKVQSWGCNLSPQEMTDTSYFHGLHSQTLHSCWCVGVHSRVLGFIAEVKTMQI